MAGANWALATILWEEKGRGERNIVGEREEVLGI
jgi:hypothetical protein